MLQAQGLGIQNYFLAILRFHRSHATDGRCTGDVAHIVVAVDEDDLTSAFTRNVLLRNA
jgi:hypothetical protein